MTKYETALAIANEYRQQDNRTNGYIILNSDLKTVCGLSLNLSRPNAYMPGVYAIDIDGNFFIATGGNDYDGAERFEPLCPALPEQGGATLFSVDSNNNPTTKPLTEEKTREDDNSFDVIKNKEPIIEYPNIWLVGDEYSHFLLNLENQSLIENLLEEKIETLKTYIFENIASPRVLKDEKIKSIVSLIVKYNLLLSELQDIDPETNHLLSELKGYGVYSSILDDFRDC